MYKCSVKCCETLDTMEDVQRCVENCSESLHRAQGIIGQELKTYQASMCYSVVYWAALQYKQDLKILE